MVCVKTVWWDYGQYYFLKMLKKLLSIQSQHTPSHKRREKRKYSTLASYSNAVFQIENRISIVKQYI
jgi:hypothetical protein